MEYFESKFIMSDDGDGVALRSCFAPNGDWYLTMHKDGFADISFRISTSGSQIPNAVRTAMFNLCKEMVESENTPQSLEIEVLRSKISEGVVAAQKLEQYLQDAGGRALANRDQTPLIKLEGMVEGGTLTRIINAFRNSGEEPTFGTFEKALENRELRRMRNIGKKSIIDIQMAISEYKAKGGGQ